jgi:pre-mRNA-processing factor SLU7
MTHSLKECTDRPRKVGAKYSGRDFKGDEYVENLSLNYEEKRDRWNGYNSNNYKFVIDEYNM